MATQRPPAQTTVTTTEITDTITAAPPIQPDRPTRPEAPVPEPSKDDTTATAAETKTADEMQQVAQAKTRMSVIRTLRGLASDFNTWRNSLSLGRRGERGHARPTILRADTEPGEEGVGGEAQDGHEPEAVMTMRTRARSHRGPLSDVLSHLDLGSPASSLAAGSVTGTGTATETAEQARGHSHERHLQTTPSNLDLDEDRRQSASPTSRDKVRVSDQPRTSGQSFQHPPFSFASGSERLDVRRSPVLDQTQVHGPENRPQPRIHFEDREGPIREDWGEVELPGYTEPEDARLRARLVAHNLARRTRAMASSSRQQRGALASSTRQRRTYVRSFTPRVPVRGHSRFVRDAYQDPAAVVLEELAADAAEEYSAPVEEEQVEDADNESLPPRHRIRIRERYIDPRAESPPLRKAVRKATTLPRLRNIGSAVRDANHRAWGISTARLQGDASASAVHPDVERDPSQARVPHQRPYIDLGEGIRTNVWPKRNRAAEIAKKEREEEEGFHPRTGRLSLDEQVDMDLYGERHKPPKREQRFFNSLPDPLRRLHQFHKDAVKASKEGPEDPNTAGVHVKSGTIRAKKDARDLNDFANGGMKINKNRMGLWPTWRAAPKKPNTDVDEPWGGPSSQPGTVVDGNGDRYRLHAEEPLPRYETETATRRSARDRRPGEAIRPDVPRPTSTAIPSADPPNPIGGTPGNSIRRPRHSNSFENNFYVPDDSDAADQDKGWDGKKKHNPPGFPAAGTRRWHRGQSFGVPHFTNPFSTKPPDRRPPSSRHSEHDCQPNCAHITPNPHDEARARRAEEASNSFSDFSSVIQNPRASLRFGADRVRHDVTKFFRGNRQDLSIPHAQPNLTPEDIALQDLSKGETATGRMRANADGTFEIVRTTVAPERLVREAKEDRQRRAAEAYARNQSEASSSARVRYSPRDRPENIAEPDTAEDTDPHDLRVRNQAYVESAEDTETDSEDIREAERKAGRAMVGKKTPSPLGKGKGKAKAEDQTPTRAGPSGGVFGNRTNTGFSFRMSPRGKGKGKGKARQQSPTRAAGGASVEDTDSEDIWKAELAAGRALRGENTPSSRGKWKGKGKATDQTQTPTRAGSGALGNITNQASGSSSRALGTQAMRQHIAHPNPYGKLPTPREDTEHWPLYTPENFDPLPPPPPQLIFHRPGGPSSFPDRLLEPPFHWNHERRNAVDHTSGAGLDEPRPRPSAFTEHLSSSDEADATPTRSKRVKGKGKAIESDFYEGMDTIDAPGGGEADASIPSPHPVSPSSVYSVPSIVSDPLIRFPTPVAHYSTEHPLYDFRGPSPTSGPAVYFGEAAYINGHGPEAFSPWNFKSLRRGAVDRDMVKEYTDDALVRCRFEEKEREECVRFSRNEVLEGSDGKWEGMWNGMYSTVQGREFWGRSPLGYEPGGQFDDGRRVWGRGVRTAAVGIVGGGQGGDDDDDDDDAPPADHPSHPPGPPGSPGGFFPPPPPPPHLDDDNDDDDDHPGKPGNSSKRKSTSGHGYGKTILVKSQVDNSGGYVDDDNVAEDMASDPGTSVPSVDDYREPNEANGKREGKAKENEPPEQGWRRSSTVVGGAAAAADGNDALPRLSPAAARARARLSSFGSNALGTGHAASTPEGSPQQQGNKLGMSPAADLPIPPPPAVSPHTSLTPDRYSHEPPSPPGPSGSELLSLYQHEQVLPGPPPLGGMERLQPMQPMHTGATVVTVTTTFVPSDEDTDNRPSLESNTTVRPSTEILQQLEQGTGNEALVSDVPSPEVATPLGGMSLANLEALEVAADDGPNDGAVVDTVQSRGGAAGDEDENVQPHDGVNTESESGTIPSLFASSIDPRESQPQPPRPPSQSSSQASENWELSQNPDGSIWRMIYGQDGSFEMELVARARGPGATPDSRPFEDEEDGESLISIDSGDLDLQLPPPLYDGEDPNPSDARTAILADGEPYTDDGATNRSEEFTEAELARVRFVNPGVVIADGGVPSESGFVSENSEGLLPGDSYSQQSESSYQGESSATARNRARLRGGMSPDEHAAGPSGDGYAAGPPRDDDATPRPTDTGNASASGSGDVPTQSESSAEGNQSPPRSEAQADSGLGTSIATASGQAPSSSGSSSDAGGGPGGDSSAYFLPPPAMPLAYNMTRRPETGTDAETAPHRSPEQFDPRRDSYFPDMGARSPQAGPSRRHTRPRANSTASAPGRSRRHMGAGASSSTDGSSFSGASGAGPSGRYVASRASAPGPSRMRLSPSRTHPYNNTNRQTRSSVDTWTSPHRAPPQPSEEEDHFFPDISQATPAQHAVLNRQHATITAELHALHQALRPGQRPWGEPLHFGTVDDLHRDRLQRAAWRAIWARERTQREAWIGILPPLPLGVPRTDALDPWGGFRRTMNLPGYVRPCGGAGPRNRHAMDGNGQGNGQHYHHHRSVPGQSQASSPRPVNSQSMAQSNVWRRNQVETYASVTASGSRMNDAQSSSSSSPEVVPRGYGSAPNGASLIDPAPESPRLPQPGHRDDTQRINARTAGGRADAGGYVAYERDASGIYRASGPEAPRGSGTNSLRQFVTSNARSREAMRLYGNGSSSRGAQASRAQTNDAGSRYASPYGTHTSGTGQSSSPIRGLVSRALSRVLSNSSATLRDGTQITWDHTNGNVLHNAPPGSRSRQNATHFQDRALSTSSATLRDGTHVTWDHSSGNVLHSAPPPTRSRQNATHLGDDNRQEGVDNQNLSFSPSPSQQIRRRSQNNSSASGQPGPSPTRILRSSRRPRPLGSIRDRGLALSEDSEDTVMEDAGPINDSSQTIVPSGMRSASSQSAQSNITSRTDDSAESAEGEQRVDRHLGTLFGARLMPGGDSPTVPPDESAGGDDQTEPPDEPASAPDDKELGLEPSQDPNEEVRERGGAPELLTFSNENTMLAPEYWFTARLDSIHSIFLLWQQQPDDLHCVPPSSKSESDVLWPDSVLRWRAEFPATPRWYIIYLHRRFTSFTLEIIAARERDSCSAANIFVRDLELFLKQYRDRVLRTRAWQPLSLGLGARLDAALQRWHSTRDTIDVLDIDSSAEHIRVVLRQIGAEGNRSARDVQPANLREAMQAGGIERDLFFAQMAIRRAENWIDAENSFRNPENRIQSTPYSIRRGIEVTRQMDRSPDLAKGSAHLFERFGSFRTELEERVGTNLKERESAKEAAEPEKLPGPPGPSNSSSYANLDTSLAAANSAEPAKTVEHDKSDDSTKPTSSELEDFKNFLVETALRLGSLRRAINEARSKQRDFEAQQLAEELKSFGAGTQRRRDHYLAKNSALGEMVVDTLAISSEIATELQLAWTPAPRAAPSAPEAVLPREASASPRPATPLSRYRFDGLSQGQCEAREKRFTADSKSFQSDATLSRKRDRAVWEQLNRDSELDAPTDAPFRVTRPRLESEPDPDPSIGPHSKVSWSFMGKNRQRRELHSHISNLEHDLASARELDYAEDIDSLERQLAEARHEDEMRVKSFGELHCIFAEENAMERSRNEARAEGNEEVVRSLEEKLRWFRATDSSRDDHVDNRLAYIELLLNYERALGLFIDDAVADRKYDLVLSYRQSLERVQLRIEGENLQEEAKRLANLVRERSETLKPSGDDN